MATALFAEHAKSRVAIFYKGSVFSGYRSKGCLLVIFFELAHLTVAEGMLCFHTDKFLSFLQIFDEASLETIMREREMGCMQYSANPWHIPWEHPFANNIQVNCTVKWGRKNPQGHEGGNLACNRHF